MYIVGVAVAQITPSTPLYSRQAVHRPYIPNSVLCVPQPDDFALFLGGLLHSVMQTMTKCLYVYIQIFTLCIIMTNAWMELLLRVRLYLYNMCFV